MKVVRTSLQGQAAAENDAKSQADIVLYSGGVIKNNNDGDENKKIIILSNVSISFYNDDNQPKIEEKYYWITITEYVYEENEIHMKFDDNLISFQSHEANIIHRKTIDILCHVLTHKELGKLNLKRYEIPKYLVNGMGLYSRMKQISAKKDIQIPPKLLEKLINYLSSLTTTMKFTIDDQIFPYLPLFLDTIIQYKRMENLILPPLNNSSIFDVLSTYFENGLSLKHILIADQPKSDEQFNSFCQSIKSSKLTGISFKDIPFTENTLQSLQDTVIDLKIKSLSLQNCLDKSLSKIFTNEFLAGFVTANLQMLNLDNTQSLLIGKSLKGILKNISYIRSISLANCQLDVYDTLIDIGLADFKFLRYINLSKNTCSEFQKPLPIIPNQIYRIDLNDVWWNKNALPSFLNFILQRKWQKGLRLHIKNAKINEENQETDWNSIETIFKQAKNYPFTELSWCGNRISNSFIEFLPKNQFLSKLFVSNCFSADQAGYIEQFSSALPKINQLKYFVLKGSKNHKLKDSLFPILTALKKCPKLFYVDVSQHKAGNSMFDLLADVIFSNASLTTINFDGSKFTDFDVVFDLINIVKHRETPLKIQFPLNDIEQLKNSNTDQNNKKTILSNISKLKEELYNMRYCFTDLLHKSNLSNVEFALSKLNKKRSVSTFLFFDTKNITDETNKDHLDIKSESAFNEPFEIFLTDFTEKFPIYSNRSLSKEFRTRFSKLNDIGRSPEKYERLKLYSQTNADSVLTDDALLFDDNMVNEEEEKNDNNSKNFPKNKIQRSNSEIADYEEMDYSDEEEEEEEYDDDDDDDDDDLFGSSCFSQKKKKIQRPIPLSPSPPPSKRKNFKSCSTSNSEIEYELDKINHSLDSNSNKESVIQNDTSSNQKDILFIEGIDEVKGEMRSQQKNDVEIFQNEIKLLEIKDFKNNECQQSILEKEKEDNKEQIKESIPVQKANETNNPNEAKEGNKLNELNNITPLKQIKPILQLLEETTPQEGERIQDNKSVNDSPTKKNKFHFTPLKTVQPFHLAPLPKFKAENQNKKKVHFEKNETIENEKPTNKSNQKETIDEKVTSKKNNEIKLIPNEFQAQAGRNMRVKENHENQIKESSFHDSSIDEYNEMESDVFLSFHEPLEAIKDDNEKKKEVEEETKEVEDTQEEEEETKEEEEEEDTKEEEEETKEEEEEEETKEEEEDTKEVEEETKEEEEETKEEETKEEEESFDEDLFDRDYSFIHEDYGIFWEFPLPPPQQPTNDTQRIKELRNIVSLSRLVNSLVLRK